MSIAERLHSDLKAAMRERDELRRETLRMAISAANRAEKDARRPLSDDELVGVLTREVRTRRESVAAYRNAGREELATKEEAEVGILAAYLPEALGEDALRRPVAAAIEETGATSPRDLGRVMAVLAPRTRGRAEGKAVSGLVAQALAQRDLAEHRQ